MSDTPLHQTLTPLQHWMRLASVEEQEELALRAGTSREYLYQIGTGTGYRNGSSALAGRIERAAAAIRESSPRRELLPVLTRAAVSPECRDCSYLLRCAGSADAFDTVDTSNIPARTTREEHKP